MGTPGGGRVVVVPGYPPKGREEGIEKGFQEGEVRGMEKGENKGRKEVARALLGEGVAIDIISKSSGLSEQEIRELSTASD